MSDANRVGLSYVKESTFAVTPATPTLKEIRFTSENLKLDTTTLVSNELRSDRQVSSIERSGLKVSGQIAYELSAQAFDDFFEYTLQADSTWGGTTTVTGSGISAAASDNSFNDSNNGFTSPAFDAGRVIKTTGFGTTNDSLWLIVYRSSNAKILVVGVNAVLTVSAAGGRSVISQDFIANGITYSSVAIQKEHKDLGSTFYMYNGSSFEQFSLGITPTDMIKGAFDFLGKIPTASTTAPAGSSTSAAPTNTTMQGIDYVPWVIEGDMDSVPGAAVLQVTKLDLMVKNNLRDRLVVGTLGPISIGTGRFEASGTIAAYFSSANKATYAKYLNGTTSGLAFACMDLNGKGYAFTMPIVRITAADQPTPGINQDVMLNLSFQAYRDPITGITMKISRLA